MEAAASRKGCCRGREGRFTLGKTLAKAKRAIEDAGRARCKDDLSAQPPVAAEDARPAEAICGGSRLQQTAAAEKAVSDKAAASKPTAPASANHLHRLPLLAAAMVLVCSLPHGQDVLIKDEFGRASVTLQITRIKGEKIDLLRPIFVVSNCDVCQAHGLQNEHHNGQDDNGDDGKPGQSCSDVPRRTAHDVEWLRKQITK